MINAYLNNNISTYENTLQTYTRFNQLYNQNTSITIEYYNQEIKAIPQLHDIKVYNTTHVNTQKNSFNNAKYTKYKYNPTFISEQESLEFVYGNDINSFGLETNSTLTIISKFVPLIGDYFIPEQQNKFIYEVTSVETNPQYSNNLNLYKLNYRLAEIGNKEQFLSSLTILNEEYFSSFYNTYFNISTLKTHNLIVNNKRQIEQFIASDKILTSIFNQRTSVYLIPYTKDRASIHTLAEYYQTTEDVQILEGLMLKEFLWFELSSAKGIL